MCIGISFGVTYSQSIFKLAIFMIFWVRLFIRRRRKCWRLLKIFLMGCCIWREIILYIVIWSLRIYSWRGLMLLLLILASLKNLSIMFIIFREPFYDLQIGSPPYMAPESLVRGIYCNKSDVWSFGVLLYEIFHGEGPYIKSSDLK